MEEFSLCCLHVNVIIWPVIIISVTFLFSFVTVTHTDIGAATFLSHMIYEGWMNVGIRHASLDHRSRKMM